MKTYLLLAALLCTFTLPAQEAVLFDDVQEQTLVYRYHHLSEPSAGTLQQIIRCLAPNQLNQPAFDLTYAYQLQILERPDVLKVCINWQSLNVDREIRPLGFPFADLLVPSGAVFNLELLADGEVVRSECIQQQFGSTLPSHTYDFTDIEGGVYYTLRVNDLHFKYSSAQVQDVRNRKQAIDDYLASKERLIQLHDRLEALRQTEVQPQHIDNYQQQLSNYQQQLDRLCKAAFWHILDLNAGNAHDPEDVKRHRDICREDIRNLQNWLADLKANLHVLYFDQGVDLFEAGNRHAAREAFCASLRSNDCYAPSHYFIAFLDFEAGQIEPAGQRVIKVLNQYNPDPATRVDATRLASGIVRFYLDAGQNAVAQRKYPEGVALYEEALSFSESIRSFDFGQGEAVSRIKEAYYLDFHDQLDQVVYHQRNGQFDVALQQLEQALAFQERFRVNSTVDTRRLAAQIVDALYEERLAATTALRREKQYDKALTAVKEIEALLQSYPDLVRRPLALESEKKLILSEKFQAMLAQTEQLVEERRLDQALQQAQNTYHFTKNYDLDDSMQREGERQIVRVQQLRYERFIRGGERARQTGQYVQSLEQFDAAQALETSVNGLRKDASLGSRITGVALAEAEGLFGQTMSSAGSDNDRIRSTRGQIQAVVNKYDLAQQPKIVNIFNQMDDQLCTNARTILLPQQEEQLARQQQARDYIAARKTIGSIRNLLETYGSCGLSNASLLMHETIVLACADYQEKLQTAETAEQQGRFSRAIEYYVLSKAAYQDASVQARLASHPAFYLEQYLHGHPSYHMQLAGAHYYLNQREHGQALSLLNLIIANGVPPQATEGLQQRLGSALAVRHYVATAKWKDTYYGFVSRDDRKAYKAMYRSFRKQWKRMV